MVLNKICSLAENKNPLELINLSDPITREGEILVKNSACGVCHTEWDEIEGRMPPTRFPVIPGHRVIGRVEKTYDRRSKYKIGDRVGIAWIHSACRRCKFCLEGNENLCNHFRATGRDVHGGYAQYITVPGAFVYRIPEIFSDSEAAPLLCAGAIGYRSLRLTGIKDGLLLGLTGFGASAHLVMKMTKYKYPNVKVFVFARNEKVDKEYLLKLSYPAHLWLEKEIKSVANVCRSDVSEFLKLAAEIPIESESTTRTDYS